MDVRLHVLLVIHNRACEDSPPCEQLRLLPNARVVVVDNSTEPNDNGRYCAARGFGYLSMGGNLGLAKAYNHGIAWIKQNTDATHVVLFDDDTALPETFLDETAAYIAKTDNEQIFLPVVYDEKGLLSPCAIDGLRVRRLTSPYEVTPKGITGINSGMTIDLAVFDDYRYDERYFLDYIDHAFVRDMKARGYFFAVTMLELRQQFFDNARGNKQAARRRLAIFKKDFRRFCGRSLKGRLTAQAVIIKRCVKIALSS